MANRIRSQGRGGELEKGNYLAYTGVCYRTEYVFWGVSNRQQGVLRFHYLQRQEQGVFLSG